MLVLKILRVLAVVELTTKFIDHFSTTTVVNKHPKCNALRCNVGFSCINLDSYCPVQYNTLRTIADAKNTPPAAVLSEDSTRKSTCLSRMGSRPPATATVNKPNAAIILKAFADPCSSLSSAMTLQRNVDSCSGFGVDRSACLYLHNLLL